MCIVCLMKEAGMSDEAFRLAKALFSQMYSQNEVLKLIVKEVPGLSTPALCDIINTGDIIGRENITSTRVEPVTPNDVFEASNVFPINSTKH